MAKASVSQQFGLTFGAMAGLVHLVWSILVALELAQPLANFIANVHMVQAAPVVLPFAFETAAMLVVITTLIGYVVGFVFGTIWTEVQKRT